MIGSEVATPVLWTHSIGQEASSLVDKSKTINAWYELSKAFIDFW